MKKATYALLIAVALGFLLAVNVDLARRPVDISADFSGVATLQQTAAAAGIGASTIDAGFELTETLARPLFSPTRREFIAPALIPEDAAEPMPEPVESFDAPPPQIMEKPEISLLGTRRIGSTLSALVQDGADNSSKWVTVGEMLHDWTIAKINEDGLVLSSGGGTATYLLYPVITDADL